jgi:hypothetical protein
MSDDHVTMFADDARIEALSAYTDSLDELAEIFAEASAGDGALLDRRPAEDAWSVAEVIHHVADAELSSAVDLRRILGEDVPALLDWDEQDYAAAMLYDVRPAADALAVILATRNLNVRLLASLSPQQWSRRAIDPNDGEIDVTGWVMSSAAHLKAHVLQARRSLIGMI